MSDIERVNIYDEAGKLIRSMNRLKAEAQNERTENVLILIFTSEGKLWMQRRAKYKTHYPNMWDISAVGGVESGEDPDAAATRELLEETGLRTKLTYLETIARELLHTDGTILLRHSHLFVGMSDQVPVPNQEVLEFKAWDIAELFKDMKDNPAEYLPNLSPLIEKARDTKNPSS